MPWVVRFKFESADFYNHYNDMVIMDDTWKAWCRIDSNTIKEGTHTFLGNLTVNNTLCASQVRGSRFHVRIKNAMTLTATIACAFALTACGGGDDSSGSGTALSRADEGIWSNPSNGMQAVILSDGSYWGIYGSIGTDGTYGMVSDVLHGAASVSGGNVSGSYIDFANWSGTGGNGTYSGTVSAQNALNLAFKAPSANLMLGGGSFNMSYDGIYTQPASLATIAGDYLAGGGRIAHCPINGCPPGIPRLGPYPNLIISDSNLTLNDNNGNVAMTGTITPHGTTVNVFDVSLTATVMGAAQVTLEGATLGTMGLPPYGYNIPAGTTYKGILFQTSSGGSKNYIEVVAATENYAFYFMGSKQD
jgi:hypothetical protein